MKEFMAKNRQFFTNFLQLFFRVNDIHVFVHKRSMENNIEMTSLRSLMLFQLTLYCLLLLEVVQKGHSKARKGTEGQ